MDRLDYTPTNQSALSRPNSDVAWMKWIADRVEQLTGRFKRDEWNNAKLAFDGMVRLLAEYPPEVVMAVTDPVKGLPVECETFPSLKRIKEACEREMAHRRSVARYEGLKPIESLPRPKLDRSKTYDAMFEKHGRPFGAFEVGRTLPYKG